MVTGAVKHLHEQMHSSAEGWLAGWLAASFGLSLI